MPPRAKAVPGLLVLHTGRGINSRARLKVVPNSSKPIPLPGLYPKVTKILILNNTYSTMFIAALFKIVKAQKQPKCPLLDEWIKKFHPLFSHGREESLSFVTAWLYLEVFMLCEISQPKSNILSSHLYVDA